MAFWARNLNWDILGESRTQLKTQKGKKKWREKERVNGKLD